MKKSLWLLGFFYWGLIFNLVGANKNDVMANEEHVRILKEGVEVWNAWRVKSKYYFGIPQEADLEEVDLREADLNDAKLRGANLRGANLDRANFEQADLSGADLRNAKLSDANLDGANLCGANLYGADLRGANLRVVEVEVEDDEAKGALTPGSIYFRADLRGADLCEADLTRADLSRADLTRATLSSAHLNGTDLSETDLSETDLSGTDLSGANFTGANLYNANLIESKLEKVNFKHAKLSRTIFGHTNLSQCLHLDQVQVKGPCVIDLPTLKASQNLPLLFLKKMGLSGEAPAYAGDLLSGDPIQLFPAFLSHSHNDKEFARQLYDQLIENGAHCWFDEKEMKPGDEIYESINQGIKVFDKMILVCSKQSLQESWWVDQEIKRLLAKERRYRKEKHDRIHLLIPIAVDDYVFTEWEHPNKEEILRYMVGDFRNWKDPAAFKRALHELIMALNVNRKAHTPPSYL